MPKLHKKPRVVVETLVRPADADAKSAWVAYAVSVGVDSTGTKTEIIEAVDNAVE